MFSEEVTWIEMFNEMLVLGKDLLYIMSFITIAGAVLSIVGVIVYHLIMSICYYRETIDNIRRTTNNIKKFIIKIFDKYPYLYRIDHYIEMYKELNNEKFNSLISCVEDYKKLIITYKVKKPTKAGKIILNRFHKSLKVFKQYTEYSNFEKESDIFKVSDLNKVIDEEIDSIIEMIKSDTLVIRQQGLSTLVTDIRNLYK